MQGHICYPKQRVIMIRARAELLTAHPSPVGMGKQLGGDGAVPWVCWSPAALISVQGDFQVTEKLQLPPLICLAFHHQNI